MLIIQSRYLTSHLKPAIVTERVLANGHSSAYFNAAVSVGEGLKDLTTV